METNPFSPTTAFPLSFFEEDMMLFTGNANSSDLAAAWADMGMGQGRSVSSMINPYHLDILDGQRSPSLQSPLNISAVDTNGMGSNGFLANQPPLLLRTGTKRGNSLDGGNGNRNGVTVASTKKQSSSVDTNDEEDEEAPPAQKRQRRDTNADRFSSDEGTGTSGMDETRRDSMGGDGKSERPRLTEEEKKNNHIASEQKRRMAIRDGFDRLTELVPGLEGQGRSESIVLRKTVDYMRKVVEDRRNLIQKVQDLGGEIPTELLLR